MKKYPIISDQIDTRELRVILRELKKVLQDDVPGDVVEFGCYEGTTSLFIQRLLQQTGSTKSFHVYDSFAGLPEKTVKDRSPAGEQFKSGELAANKKNFIRNFKQSGLVLPKIHKSWFDQLSNRDIPSKIAFAFLDGDFYDSIRDSLHLIENKMQSSGMIIIDDYQSEALPGAAKATDEWLVHKQFPLKTEASLAIIHVLQ